MITARVNLADAERDFPDLKQSHGRSGQRSALLERRWGMPVTKVISYGSYIEVRVNGSINVAEIAVLMGTSLSDEGQTYRLAAIENAGQDRGLELLFQV